MRAIRLAFVLMTGAIFPLAANELESSDHGLPRGVVARLGTAVRSSRHQAVALAFSSDDRVLACAGLRTHRFRDANALFPIEVYETEGMKRVCILDGSDSPIVALQIAPSKDCLVSLAADGTVQLWSISSAECQWTAHLPRAKQIVFSSDDHHLFVADFSGRVSVLGRESGDAVREHDLTSQDQAEPSAIPWMTPPATSGTNSGDKKRTTRVQFSQKDGVMTIMEEGKPPVRVDLRAMGRKMNYWRRLTLLPDGENLVWLTDDGDFQVRDVMTTESVDQPKFVAGVAILRKFSSQDEQPSPVGLLWPASNCQSLQVRISDVAALIDLDTGAVKKTLFSWPPPASYVDGDYSLSPDVRAGQSRGLGRCTTSWAAESLAVSMVGQRAALMGRRQANRAEVRVLDLEREATIQTFALESHYGEREVYRGRVSDATQLRALKPVAAVFSNDGQRLAIELLGEIRLLDIDRGNEIVGENVAAKDELIQQEHEDKIAAVAFSPNGKFVATASYDSTIRLWEASSGKEVLRREHGWVYSSQHAVAFSPDSVLLAAGLGNKVEILRCSSGETVCELQGPEVASVSGRAPAVGFSADGKRVATWHDSRRTLTWWEVPSGRQLKTVKMELLAEDKPTERPNHNDRGSLQSFSFSPDMRRLSMAVYLDRVLLQFDTWTGARLTKATSRGHLSAACFSLDAGRFALGGDGEPLRVCDTKTGEVLHEIVPAGRRRQELSGYWMNPSHDMRQGIGSGSGSEQPRAFLDQGRVLATEDLGGTRLYDLESGNVIGELPEHGIRAVSPDGRLAATVLQRTVTSVNGDLWPTASTVLVWDVRRLLEAGESPEVSDLDLGHSLPMD